MVASKWHKLDEAEGYGALGGVADEVGKFVEVQTTHHHGVDLQVLVASIQCGVDTGKDVVECVATGKLKKSIATECVERDIQAVNRGADGGDMAL